MAEESTASSKGTIQIQPPKSTLDLTTVLGIVLTFSLIAIAIMIAVSGLQLLFSGVKECIKSRGVELEVQA